MSLKFNILFVNDVHIADSAPAKRTETYGEDIKAKLLEIRQIAEEQDANIALFAGDIFHHKHAHRVTHKTVNWLCEYFMGFDCPVYIVIGNHDIPDGRLESLEKQPLGVIGNLSNVTLMGWDQYAFNFEGTNPFRDDRNSDITISSIPGVPGVTIADYAKPQRDQGSKWHVLAVHQSVVPDKSKLPPVLQDKDFMHDSQDVANVTDADVILYGHEHGNHGIYARSGKLFVNLGAICRGSLTESDLNREPQVFLLKLGETISGAPIKLKNVKPAAEVFRLEEHVAAQEHRADIDDAIGRLNDTKLTIFSIETVIGEIEVRDDIDASARATALDLLEAVK